MITLLYSCGGKTCISPIYSWRKCATLFQCCIKHEKVAYDMTSSVGFHTSPKTCMRPIRRERVSNYGRIKGEDSRFDILIIPGFTEEPQQKRRAKRKHVKTPPPRFQQMSPDQDWTSVWPTAQTFKWSVVPLPLRQGFVEGTENDGVPPYKYANAELMKIPNFLHLTPNHIKKHCEALKQFCTPWPKELNNDANIQKHFPLEVIESDYLLSGPTVHDERARTVTVKFPLSALKLDYHARDKMVRLLGSRYDQHTGVVTITSDRCPLKKQNYDFIIYSLTAVFNESWKTEPWEEGKALEDMEKYFWDLTPSKSKIVDLVTKQKETAQDSRKVTQLSHVNVLKSTDADDIVSTEAVQEYKTSVSRIYNEGEDEITVDKYKKASVQLLLGKNLSVM